MANQVAVRAPAIALSEKEARNYAAAFAASNMFKGAGANMTPDEALVVIMAGQEFGWGPAAALMNLHVIEGRPELSADAQARFIKASGKYEYRITEHTNEACEITVLAVPSGEIIGVERFTIADAQLQGLTNRRNWKVVPRNMLFARCISNVSAFHCPDALPMRTYAIGEVDGFGRDSAAAEQREMTPPPTPEQVAAAEKIEEEVIEDAEVEVVRPAGYAEAQRDYSTPSTHPDAIVVTPPEKHDRFSPEAVEERLRADLKQISDSDKALIKAYVTDRVAFTFPNMARMIVEAGFTDVHSWWRNVKAPKAASEPPIPKSPYLDSGITGRDTGSQTTIRTISDKQMKMFNAKCSGIGLNAEERKRLEGIVGVSSARQLDNEKLDKLLSVISEIEAGGDSVRRLYLGGEESE